MCIYIYIDIHITIFVGTEIVTVFLLIDTDIIQPLWPKVCWLIPPDSLELLWMVAKSCS